MAINVDSLQIEIGASSEKAAQAVRSVASALESLKKSVSGSGRHFATLAKQLQSLSDVAHGMKDSMAPFASAAKTIEQLGSMGKVRLSKTIGDGLRNIGDAARSFTPDAIANLEAATRALERLSGVDLRGAGSAMRAAMGARVGSERSRRPTR